MAEASLLDLIDTFNAAPFQKGGWQQALADLASSTQSRAAQLIGFSEGSEPFFDCVTGVDPEWLHLFQTAGGGLPQINPRLGAGLEAPLLQTLTDESIVDRAQRSRHAFYNEVLPLSHTAHFCGTNLIRETDMMVGLAVLRQAHEGEITEPQHRLFSSVAPHVRTAFRTQLLLQDHGVTLLTGSLEALALSAFICDHEGRVQSLTPSAEMLVSGIGPLQLQAGRLRTRYGGAQQPLSEAIHEVASQRGANQRSTSRHLVVREASGLPLAIDIVQVPTLDCPLDFRPRALVLVRKHKHSRETTRQLLTAAFGMTESEAAVALLLADGFHPETIAERRQVSSGTVRMQLKSLYAKCDVHSQIELVARLRPLL
ncbi:helix-turn-helix transcriptional regulator [Hydrocarboniclastica marina]|uniref:LuxR family transcriptional regulator n=1 Tax=Hydrocarboniclastica marina TaxID=2259620 RepID=A0A4P7XLW7_9ALTE|nr:helix-turn-helix transcriptional regulator [Hydrocarboniclastica marina]QCF27594.1 LuxR family transcriptional regulator [Hydrocarboniclastica marina]